MSVKRIVGGGALSAALVLGVLLVSRETTASPPPPPPGQGQLLTYQGRLVDSNGKPMEGTLGSLTFKLYRSQAAAPADFVWGEQHSTVAVRRGVFTVLLGGGTQAVAADGTPIGAPGPNPIGDGVFDGGDRWLQVQVNGDPALPGVRLGSVPYAISAGGSVPVGGIVDWVRPTPTTPVPAGWQICDGSLINDTASALNGKRTPNLVARFVSGLDPANLGSYGYAAGETPGLPELGGQATLDLQHRHDALLPPHRHSIAVGGGHAHGAFLGNTPEGHLTTAHTFDRFEGAPSHFLQIALLGPGAFCTHAVPVQVGSAGDHTHGGGFTGLDDGTTTSLQTSDRLSNGTDNRPPFVGLLKLIRIK